MVLVIASIVMGGAIGLMVYSSDERTLRDTSGEIELLAKRARMAAILQQTPYALEFRDGVVRMLPFAEVGRDEDYTAGGHRIGGDTVETKPGERREIQIEPGVSVFVRRWNSEAWLPTEKKSIHAWRFVPSGLCDPLSLRFTLDKSWCENTYHPLTATVRYSEIEAR